MDQPEGVEDLDAHPSEGAKQGIVEACPHPGAHCLASCIGQDSSEEEEQIEEGERHSQAQVDGDRLLLRAPAGGERTNKMTCNYNIFIYWLIKYTSLHKHYLFLRR